MKPIFAHAAGALALSFAIAACRPAPSSTPAPAPAPTPVASTPAPPPPPVASNWIDNPQSPGDWRYRAVDGGSMAEFGPANSEARFAIGCSTTSRRMALIRYVPGLDDGTIMTIRTETANRSVTTKLSKDGGAVSATLPASDPLLDAMALTRGRFAVEIGGTPALYLPNWAEVTRVIEDCR